MTVDKGSIGFDLLELEHAAYMVLEEGGGGGGGGEERLLEESTGEVEKLSNEEKSDQDKGEEEEEEEEEEEDEEEEDEEFDDEKVHCKEEQTLTELKLPNQLVSSTGVLIEELPPHSPTSTSNELLDEPVAPPSAVRESEVGKCTDLMGTVTLED